MIKNHNLSTLLKKMKRSGLSDRARIRDGDQLLGFGDNKFSQLSSAPEKLFQAPVQLPQREEQQFILSIHNVFLKQYKLSIGAKHLAGMMRKRWLFLDFIKIGQCFEPFLKNSSKTNCLAMKVNSCLYNKPLSLRSMKILFVFFIFNSMSIFLVLFC